MVSRPDPPLTVLSFNKKILHHPDLVVSHQHRYGKHYQKVKEIVASGALGRVHTVYGSATGWMTHMLSHLIDYTCWFNGYAPATAKWKIPVSHVHGTQDFNPISLTHQDRTDFQKAGHVFTLHEHAGGHTITPAQVRLQYNDLAGAVSP